MSATSSAFRSLLILRPDHLGDLVLFSGALKHFRQKWPQAHIVLCVRSFGAELYERCPHVDEVVGYDDLRRDLVGQGRLSWMPEVRGCDRLGNFGRTYFPDLVRRRYRCDAAIIPILAPLEEYHKCMERLPARIRIGVRGNATNQTIESDKKSVCCYETQMDAASLPWNLPELEATRMFLKFLGIDVSENDLWPEFWTAHEDKIRAGNLMPVKSGNTILGMAPGVSSVAGKRLPAEWYAKVVKSLKWKDVQIVLLGSGADVNECDAVAMAIEKSGARINVLNLVGKTSIRELVECIRRCDLLLTQETAAVHIATALRVPAAGIVGGGHYGRFFPWGDPAVTRAVQRPMDCFGCNWQCKYETIRCIQEIPPEDAVRSLNELRQYTGRR